MREHQAQDAVALDKIPGMLFTLIGKKNTPVRFVPDKACFRQFCYCFSNGGWINTKPGGNIGGPQSPPRSKRYLT